MVETLQTAVLPRHDGRKQPAIAALAALGVVYGVLAPALFMV